MAKRPRSDGQDGGGADAQRVAHVRSLTRIRKRDGREVPFDLAKVRDAIAAAQAAVGEADPQFASEVAAVTELALRQRAGHPLSDESEYVPGIEEIQDLVEQALIELGRAAVAKAYIVYRDRRAQIRGALHVRKTGPGAGHPPRVREGDRTSTWSKGRIVAALMAEADLPRAAAERVASRVEARVFDSGMKSITTSLVRELVDNELVALGLTAALRRHGAVGLPRYDLRRVLSGRRLSTWEADVEPDVGSAPGSRGRRTHVSDTVSHEVLRRFALEDVYSERLAELHLSGEMHFEDLGRPHLYLTAAMSADLLRTDGARGGNPFDLLGAVVPLLEATSRGVVLEEPGGVLLSLVRGTRPGSSMGLPAWLRALAATARAAGRRLDLGSPGLRFSAFTERLILDLADMELVPGAPRIFLGEDELGELAQGDRELRLALESLLERGSLIPVWGGDEETYVGPGCVRRARERVALACGGAVAINLPRLAQQAGAWREDRFFEGLAARVQCALEACRALHAFQREHTTDRAQVPRARVSFAIVPVGLREALQVLSGGEVDPVLGARVLGFMAEAARRFSASKTPGLTLDPFFGRRACVRFAHLEREESYREEGRQAVLFDDLLREDRPLRPYSLGYAVAPLLGRRQGEAEAEMLTTVPTGALVPFPGDAPLGMAGAAARAPVDAFAGDEETPLLVASQRFRALRPVGVRGDRGLLFPARPFTDSNTDPDSGHSPSGEATTDDATDPQPCA